MVKKRVTKDFETRSMADLKKVGAYKYSMHPTTIPTCLAFKILGEPTVYFLPFEVVNRQWDDQDPALKKIWIRLVAEDYEFSAHNSFFERCIYDNILVARYGWPRIQPRRRRCTAAKAAAVAIPRNLEGAGEAMNLRVQKDKMGYVAMMKTCKPTKQWNEWNKIQNEIKAGKKIGAKKLAKSLLPEPPVFLEPDDAPDVWQTLYTYCKIDVRAEEALDLALPDLIPSEQEIWFLNQMLNWRGLRVDVPTVKKVVDIMAVESKRKLKELDKLTMGLVTKPGARRSILEFLALEGIELPNLRAKTVDDKLKGFELSGDMHRLLEIRKALSMTSTKKYQTFLDRANPDDRVRDILLYHGASTGRDTGTGVQPHNFPRGLISVSKDKPYATVENVAELHPEMLSILYGDSLAILFSAILRNMLIPTEFHELFVADFSKIEVAVLWWLAGNEEGLAVLRAGKDPYIYQAAANLGKTYEEIEEAVFAEEKWATDARQLGKAQVLGCGFGMGALNFMKTAWDQYRLRLKEKDAKYAVKSYRTVNEAVPLLWNGYEEAAIAATKYPGRVFKSGKCEFEKRGQFLWIKLPSGRSLAYLRPQIAWRVHEYEVTRPISQKDFGGVDEKQRDIQWDDDQNCYVEKTIKRSEPRETLEFYGLAKSKKSMQLERTWGGTITENIVQATARDLMMPAMVRLEKKGYKALLMVHDEGISEKPIGQGNLDEFVAILCELPPWATGLPLEAKGWKGPRYRK